MKENDDKEEARLNETTSETNDSQKTLIIIHHYKDIIKAQSKKAIAHF